MQMLMHSYAEVNWVIYLLYLKSGKICCTTRTAVFLKTNHLKQRTGLDICGECVGLRIPPSFQVNLDHHHLDRYQFTRDRKYYFLIVKTWLLPHSGSDQSTTRLYKNFWLSSCISRHFSHHRLLIAMSGFTFLTINHCRQPQSCLQNTFYAAAAPGVYPSSWPPGHVQGGLISCSYVSDGVGLIIP